MHEAALVAAQTYLYTMQPNPGDPREHTRAKIGRKQVNSQGRRGTPQQRYAQTEITMLSQQSST
jgi:hypothetical protein